MINHHPLRVLIFGAGAIGTYIGCSLYHAGSSVVFLERPEVASDLHIRGLRLNLPGGELSISIPNIARSIEEALQNGPFDVGIFALKSFDTPSALQRLSPFKDNLPPVLCLQNGVDNEAALAAELGPEKVIPGTVTSALSRRTAGDIVLERKRGMGIGAGHPLSTRLCFEMNLAGLNAHLYNHSKDMKWSKLMTNLLANASSAILDMVPAQVFAHPELFRLEIAQIKETLAVMQAQEIRVVDLPSTPVRLLALAVRRLPTWLSQPLIQRALGTGRGGKMPSLHIDLQTGRGKSEVSDLNGAVVQYGERLGIPTPTNRLLYQTLVQLVNKEIPWEDFRHQPNRLLQGWKTLLNQSSMNR